MQDFFIFSTFSLLGKNNTCCYKLSKAISIKDFDVLRVFFLFFFFFILPSNLMGSFAFCLQ